MKKNEEKKSKKRKTGEGRFEVMGEKNWNCALGCSNGNYKEDEKASSRRVNIPAHFEEGGA